MTYIDPDFEEKIKNQIHDQKDDQADDYDGANALKGCAERTQSRMMRHELPPLGLSPLRVSKQLGRSVISRQRPAFWFE